MKMISMLTIGAMVAASAAGAPAGATAEPSAKHSVTVVGAPLVMRLNSDEFRIAFGIDGKGCMPSGCSGSIHYRVHWTAPDGTSRADARRVAYRISPHSGRTIAVDRQYLDTAEGAHTTEVLDVRVDRITCRDDVLTRGT